MKYLQDFLENNENSDIFRILNCNEDELKILRFICKKYLSETPQIGVFDMFKQIFGELNIDFYKKLESIKSLLKRDLITQCGFLKEKSNASKLGLLYAEITPSEYLFRLLEIGKDSVEMPDKTPYNDNLEYLKDQFLRIEMYQKQSRKEEISKFEQIINARVKLSKINLPCEQIFKENNLSKNEQILFLALLHEEYSEESDILRNINALVNLISNDEFERIKNRALLDDNSNLIDSGLVGYEVSFTSLSDNLHKSFFISDEILSQIMNPKKNSQKSKKLELEAMVKESEIFELIEPNSDLDDVVLNEKTKELLENIQKQLDKKVLNRLKSWGVKSHKNIDVKVIFYGSPGTGKTMSAISLAKSLKKQVLSFDCSKILSKYVGESEQNVRKIFDTYKEICQKSKTEPVLLLNEADQFLSTRVETSSGADKMHNQMQNIFLEQIEKFQGVLIATTNFMESLDKAFSRRFDYKIEFKKPNYEERIKIWQKILPQKAEFEPKFSVEKLAEFELSGAQIVLVMKNTALKTAINDEAIFKMQNFIDEIKREINSAFDEDKKVGLL